MIETQSAKFSRTRSWHSYELKGLVAPTAEILL